MSNTINRLNCDDPNCGFISVPGMSELINAAEETVPVGMTAVVLHCTNQKCQQKFVVNIAKDGSSDDVIAAITGGKAYIADGPLTVEEAMVAVEISVSPDVIEGV